jgi:DNA-directed RNA polymerase subunit RPC12/RpoP
MEVTIWGVSCNEKKDYAQCLSCGHRALKRKFQEAVQDVSA